MEDQSSKLTRRSAGLPAIIAGLLIPSTLEEFNAVLETLSSLAKSKQDFSDIKNGQETRLPQVHALNCLREILTDSRFRSRSIAWLTKLLDLAAASLSSTVWAIRNCGLMLFRACASRIGNNADKSELETNEVDSSDQWAAILDIALKLLDSVQVNNTNSSELVFAGLDLLSRISISASDRAPTRQRILTHLGSPIWMIREHAARVYASQILDKEALETAVGLIASMEMTDQNRCHGSLLCSRKLIEKYFHRSVPFSDAKSPGIEHILQLQAPFVEQFASPAVQSAFLDIMNECIAVQRKSPMGHRALNSKEREENWQFQSLHNRTRRANSATPFVAQLSFSKALHACLVTLTEGDDTAQVLHQIFWDVAAHDTDTASALLQALTAQVSSDQHALTLFVDLYISIIQDDHSEDITAAAMYGLSSSLQAELDGDGSPLAKQTSRRLVDSLASSRDNESRDLFNARITALGNVLTLRSRETQSVWSEPSSKALNIWIKMVGHAAGDAIEAPTRLNAAKALHAFRRCFLEQCDSVAVYNKFKLCLILYDLLNDDDEEIRDLAASTTSFIVTTAGSGITVQLCPLAACHQFSDYLAENFTNKDEFHFAALSRLMFSPLNEFEDMDSHVDSFKALTSQYSVGRQLDLARQVSYDLFEEERQNLYLDDVREINFWWSIIRRISRIWIQDDILFFVGNWALEGLRELIAALPTLNDGPFGVSSKLEVIALILRVISVADLSLIWEDNSDSGSFPPRKSANLEEMEGLLFLGRKYGIHPQAQKALEDSVRRGQLNLEARGLYYRMSLEEANK